MGKRHSFHFFSHQLLFPLYSHFHHSYRHLLLWGHRHFLSRLSVHTPSLSLGPPYDILTDQTLPFPPLVFPCPSWVDFLFPPASLLPSSLLTTVRSGLTYVLILVTTSSSVSGIRLFLILSTPIFSRLPLPPS